MSRQRRWSGVVGVIGLVLCAAGAVLEPAHFFRAYLSAYQFFLGLGLGSFVILMIYHLTGGAWGYLIRRILEAGMKTLPLLALLFIPVACGIGYLFPWAQPEVVEASENLRHKQLYLNPPFFWARAVIYFLLWNGFAWLLARWSRRQDETGDPAITHRLGTLSSVGLVVFGITMQFASIDWLMSLQPSFHSTIIGPLYASGMLLSALAFALVVLAFLLPRSALGEFVSIEALNDLGNLLFSFLIIWSYMVYFQFMLVWIANLRFEVIWFLPRSRGGWYWVVWGLVIFHFAVPFFLLLLRSVKRDPSALAKVAALLLITQLVYLYYQVLPVFPDTGVVEHWIDFVTPLGIGVVWLALFLWQLERLPVTARHDANQAAALHYRQVDAEIARIEEFRHA